MIKFIIENKQFFVARDFDVSEHFVVKASPKDYPVSLDTSTMPFTAVDDLFNANTNNLLLVDEKVFALYKENFTFDKERLFLATATEEFKTIDGVLAVVKFLHDHEFTKGASLIVVGGGILEDVGAFVGACYKRGIPWIYFPTTLLSMADSCIGGKTGINYATAKNQLALFSSPAAVIINSNFLPTLAGCDLQSGLGEILKLAVIGGQDIFDLYLTSVPSGVVRDFVSYRKLILAALAVKKAVIEEDQFEFCYRKSLNYGHTLGHAIEALSKNEIPHGLAVVIGMILVNEMSFRRGFLSEKTKNLINQACFSLLDRKVKDVMRKLEFNKMREMLKRDKKTENNLVNFVLVEDLGRIKFLQIALNEELLQEITTIIGNLFGCK